MKKLIRNIYYLIRISTPIKIILQIIEKKKIVKKLLKQFIKILKVLIQRKNGSQIIFIF